MRGREEDAMASMFWLKACKRCGGDLHEEAAIDGTFTVCVQCGYGLTPEEEQALRVPTLAERRAA